MKIAIITLPLLGNYGGILQNYALQTALRAWGYEVETIILSWKRKQPLWRMPLAYGKRFVDKFVFRKSTHVFYEAWFNRTQPFLLEDLWKFVNKHIVVRNVEKFSEIAEGDYDVFIVGSDQIWRPSYSYKPITRAFLDFTRDWKNIKRVAYSASFGTDVWEYSQRQTEQCKSLIRLFDGVSVREESGVILCRDYFHCKAVHVLDPTMLIPIENYLDLFEPIKKSVAKRGELLTYVLDESSEKKQIIELISSHYHYKIYHANSRYEDETAPLIERVQPPVEQWLKDFYDASFVVTDSFHATVFSIMFNKPFVVIGNKKRGISRIASLLNMFDLQHHLIYSLDDLNFETNYSFDTYRVASRLMSLRESSFHFLYTCL